MKAFCASSSSLDRQIDQYSLLHKRLNNLKLWSNMNTISVVLFLIAIFPDNLRLEICLPSKAGYCKMQKLPQENKLGDVVFKQVTIIFISLPKVATLSDYKILFTFYKEIKKLSSKISKNNQFLGAFSVKLFKK